MYRHCVRHKAEGWGGGKEDTVCKAHTKMCTDTANDKKHIFCPGKPIGTYKKCVYIDTTNDKKHTFLSRKAIRSRSTCLPRQPIISWETVLSRSTWLAWFSSGGYPGCLSLSSHHTLIKYSTSVKRNDRHLFLSFYQQVSLCKSCFLPPPPPPFPISIPHSHTHTYTHTYTHTLMNIGAGSPMTALSKCHSL